jgi:hypothetical protein
MHRELEPTTVSQLTNSASASGLWRILPSSAKGFIQSPDTVQMVEHSLDGHLGQKERTKLIPWVNHLSGQLYPAVSAT